MQSEFPRHPRTHLGLSLLLVALVGSCARPPLRILDYGPADRAASPAPADHFGDRADEIVYLDQSWGPGESLWFYNTSQGSQLLPYEIFLHLEKTDSTQLFRSDDNMRRFRYLPQRPYGDNPDGLPIGFVKDEGPDRDYVGFNCSLCHTSQLNYKGKGIRIDGGPSVSNMEIMMEELTAALDRTIQDQSKLDRLAMAIGADDDEARAKLLQELQDAHNACDTYVKNNRPLNEQNGQPIEVHYGFGRLDAFGRIYNQVLAHLTPNRTDNNINANAPVSVPFLWDTPHHDFVQWNGVADNENVAALGRNVGQALGVFAWYDLEKHKRDVSPLYQWWTYLTSFIGVDLDRYDEEVGYRSSIKIRNIVDMERQIGKLESPRWVDAVNAFEKEKGFPEIKADRRDLGEQVFNKYECGSCHQPIDPEAPRRTIVAQFASIDLIETDELMAKNTIAHRGESGLFEGEPIQDDCKCDRFQQKTEVLPAFVKATQGVMKQPDYSKKFFVRWLQKLSDFSFAFFDDQPRDPKRHLDFEVIGERVLLAYKARPLNGIWATAPYLHNGSVATLYEMFLPACDDGEYDPITCRRNVFAVGSLEFDPIKVGFADPPNRNDPGLFRFDTRLPGNRNTGHEYTSGKTDMIVTVRRDDGELMALRNENGTFQTKRFQPITDTERMDLIEYLKSL
jgi:hypothetical protein